ncbi:GIN domain-containing protein [Maribacter stanieri]|uniref:GIN domain-containing protein n=1 Tax=Maribacter stanieri TaxID=440514 RepID=UPI0030DDD95A|tara:strand:- start:1642 stop:2469 length:828 start_codon:yes stop_codon:yes gene_type:complete
MKKFTLLVVVLFISFSGYTQRKPKIKGNKNVIEVREDLAPFTAIELVDDLDIVIQKASQEGYVLELDDNLLDVLKFKVDNGVLKISSFYNITSKKKLEITIFFQELRSIKMLNGKISMKDVISTDRLKVATFGTSRLELNATADIMDITMEEISSGDFNLASDSLNITLKDRIDVKLYTTGSSNNIYMYKNASAKLEGTADFLMAKMYGNSSLKAADLQSNDVLLITEDSPDIEIRALNTLQLSSKGSTRTKLYGEAKITILDFLDTSRLEKERN